MAANFTFVPSDAWAKGDYRPGAHIDKGVCTIEGLAAVVDARLESYIEDGLGLAKCFGVRSDSGCQVGFEEFEQSPGGGVELLVLFENGVCKRRDILDALGFFGISEHSSGGSLREQSIVNTLTSRRRLRSSSWWSGHLHVE